MSIERSPSAAPRRSAPEKPSHSSPDPPQSGLVPTSQTIGAKDIHAAIAQLATAISARHGTAKKLLLLGIANGGVTLAHRLATQLSALCPKLSTTTGTVDISFHRDDILRHPIPKEFAPTHIPADVHGATIILVDDVLFSGRTVKAALDELFDHGRPAKVELAVLVDRGGRLMPVAADYTGLFITTTAEEKVIVTLDATSPAHDSLRVESPAPAQSKIKNPKSKIL
jgi:pyrimidine operon attenuation protein/uracil phosphoribosyltransferase